MTTEIIPGRLWVASVEESFHSLPVGVQQILNVAEELRIVSRTSVLSYKHLPLHDDDPTEDITRVLDEAIEFIDRAPTLVHCLEGRSRSVCICVAYLVARRGYSVDAAVEEITLLRPQVNIYSLYLEQLKKWRMKN